MRTPAIGRGLLGCAAACAALGLFQEMAAGQSKILPVPEHGQETHMWCWAASGQMVMDFFGTSVSQCTQAKNRLGISNCCDSPVPTPCVVGGWPQFYKYGFTYNTTSNAALSLEQLKAQIDDDKPVVFSHRRADGSGHMMVLRGYTTAADSTLFEVNDPWPPPSGEQKQMPYSGYVSEASGTHWHDYYNIAKVVVVEEIVDAQELRTAGSAATLVARELHEKFRRDLRSLDGELGEPIPIYSLGIDELKQAPPDARAKLFVKNGVTKTLFPITLGGKIVSSITLEKSREDKWGAPVFGARSSTALFVGAQGRIRERVAQPRAVIGVSVPGLNFYAVAAEAEGNLIITPLLAYPELDLKENETIHAAELLPRLIEAAKKHDGRPR